MLISISKLKKLLILANLCHIETFLVVKKKKLKKSYLHHRGIEPRTAVWQSREVTIRPQWLDVKLSKSYLLIPNMNYSRFLLLPFSLFPHGGISILLLMCYLHTLKDNMQQRNHPYSILDTVRKSESLAYYLLKDQIILPTGRGILADF